MHEPIHESVPGGAFQALAPLPRASSRMLETYLADIELLAHSERRAAALRTALGLPHIAAALADPQLLSSASRYKEWCDEWLNAGIGGEALWQAWRDSARTDIDSGFDDSDWVPEEALRQLRLRRLARAASVFSSWIRPDQTAVPEAAREFELCTRIVEGMRRWYARHGLRDETVQNNLARLAVLR